MGSCLREEIFYFNNSLYRTLYLQACFNVPTRILEYWINFFNPTIVRHFPQIKTILVNESNFRFQFRHPIRGLFCGKYVTRNTLLVIICSMYSIADKNQKKEL